MEVCACVCLYQGHSQILKVEEARSLCKDVWGKCPRCIPLRKFFQLKYLNSHVLTHSEHNYAMGANTKFHLQIGIITNFEE